MNEHPQDILDEVYKILYSMGLSFNEKVNLETYQLRDVAQTVHTEWWESRAL